MSTTSADEARNKQRTAFIDEAANRALETPDDPRTGTGKNRPAPAHKTGMSGLRPTETDKTFDTLLTGLDKGLALARKAFVRYATEKGRTDASFWEALQKTLEEIVKNEAKGAVEKLPFGKVIFKAIELSEAFATGVGEAIDEVNRKLEKEYDISRLSPDEVTERDFEIMQQMRRYQARAVEELPGILLRGLSRVVEKIINDLFKGAEEALGKAVKNVAGQIAKQLARQNDLFALFNEAVSKAAGRIPEGRARVERLAFHFVSRTYVEQLGNEKLAERLEPILKKVKAEESIDVALLGGIIEVIMHSSYEGYARRVPIREGWSDLRQMLIEQSRILILRSKTTGTTIEEGATLEIKPNHLTVPSGIFHEVTRSAAGPTEAERQRFHTRWEEYLSVRERLRLMIRAQASQFQRQIYAATDDDRTEVWLRLQNKLADNRNKALDQLVEVAGQIITEFGETFDGYHLENYFRTHYPTLGEREQDIPLPRLEDAPAPRGRRR